MDPKDKQIRLADAIEELIGITKGCESRVIDLLMAVADLSEIIECPQETPSATGGRPRRRVWTAWESVVERIAAAQMAAKTCAEDMLLLLDEIGYCKTCADDFWQETPGAKL